MRAHLLVLVLACLVPASTIGVVGLVWTYREGRAALVDGAQREARATQEAIDGVLASATAGLQALATSPTLVAGDLAAFHEQAKRVLPYQAGSIVVLSDLEGQQLLNTLVPFGTPLPLHRNPLSQRRVIETGEPFVSDLFIGGVIGRPLVAVEVPVRRGDAVRATLAMGFPPERFAALIARHSNPQWVVAVLDRTGTIVARTHLAERYVGRKGLPGVLAAMAADNKGIVEAETLEGIPALAALSRSPLTGWVVVVAVPRELLMARLHVWSAWLAASCAAALIVGLLIARRLARRMAAAIDALVEPAMALGAGRPVTVTALPVQEADAVARALQRASHLLHARTSERDAAALAAAASREEARRFAHAAQHDALTGLDNRVLFRQRLAQAVQVCIDTGARLAVLFVDIDDFKRVNDVHGHAIGDELLRDVAARLRAGVRARDTVGRMGGDEFAVLIEGQSAAEAQRIAAGLVERLSRPYAVGTQTLHVSACVGIAGCPEDGFVPAQLLAAADAAMYHAKSSGKRRFSTSALTPLQ